MPVPSREPFSIGGIQYQILDRRLAEITTAGVPYAVITITGPEQSHPRIPESSNQLGVLRLKFDDIQMPIDSMTLFDVGHAGQVLDFADEMRAKGMKRIILSCEMGRCRSAAAACGIVESLGQRASWMDRRFEPNAHVRRVMAEAAQLRRGRRNRQEAALHEIAAQA